MEVYENRKWFNEVDSKVSHRQSYERHRVLPSRVLAEYCQDDTPTMATVWVSYHEAEVVESPPSSAVVYDDTALKWVASNSAKLYQQYPDHWILVANKNVVASSQDPNELLAIAEAKRIEAPFITRAVQPTKRKRMIYAE